MELFDTLKKAAKKAAKKGILAGTRVKAMKLAEKWSEIRTNPTKALFTLRSLKRDYLTSYGAKEEEETEVYLIHQARVEERKGLLGSKKVVKLLVSDPYSEFEAPTFSEHFDEEELWEIEVDPRKELEVTLSTKSAKILD